MAFEAIFLKQAGVAVAAAQPSSVLVAVIEMCPIQPPVRSAPLTSKGVLRMGVTSESRIPSVVVCHWGFMKLPTETPSLSSWVANVETL